MSFTAQLDKWTKTSLVRMDAVFKTAAQDLAEKVQTPVAKGGLMRVDSSFLRNSMAAAVNSIPSGLSEKPEGYREADFDMKPVAAAIMQAKMGDRIVFGYSAQYAPYMESRYAFIRSNVREWDRIVADAVKTVRSQYK